MLLLYKALMKQLLLLSKNNKELYGRKSHRPIEV